MNVFFCDLIGTFDGNEENRHESVERLVGNLTNICKLLNIYELLFVFVTTNEMDDLLPYINEMAMHTKNTPIKLSTQFSGHKKYFRGQITDINDNTKIDQMHHACLGKHIKRIIYADDTYMQHKIVNNLFSKVMPDIEFTSIMPSVTKEFPGSFMSNKYGIEGLNEALEYYIESISKGRSKK